jgi:hypothetical protein
VKRDTKIIDVTGAAVSMKQSSSSSNKHNDDNNNIDSDHDNDNNNSMSNVQGDHDEIKKLKKDHSEYEELLSKQQSNVKTVVLPQGLVQYEIRVSGEDRDATIYLFLIKV